jgi:hypothetical protein
MFTPRNPDNRRSYDAEGTRCRGDRPLPPHLPVDLAENRVEPVGRVPRGASHSCYVCPEAQKGTEIQTKPETNELSRRESWMSRTRPVTWAVYRFYNYALPYRRGSSRRSEIGSRRPDSTTPEAGCITSGSGGCPTGIQQRRRYQCWRGITG